MKYKVLNNQVFEFGEYKIVPIRMEDRMEILKWRNEQIFHLRQDKPLTIESQDNYFNNVVAKLFEQDKPNQILFSFLKNDVCIGYGGLVHINWIDKYAEISFIMDTSLEQDYFDENWTVYLGLIQQVAFNELNLHKIFTFAFDIRTHLYPILERSGFRLEARLKEHCFFNNQFIDACIHVKFNRQVSLRAAEKLDAELTYKWANCSEIRKFSFNKNEVSFEDHKNWFFSKIESSKVLYYIINYNQFNVGSIRLDIENGKGKISYLIDKEFHGKGLGCIALVELEKELKKELKVKEIYGDVFKENISSIKCFEKNNYKKINMDNKLLRFEKSI